MAKKRIKRGYVRLLTSQLKKAPWNYKRDDKEKAEKLIESIKREGVVQNLIVRDLGNGKYEVANGNHRLSSIKKLRIESVVCFNLGRVDQEDAERVAVETNEINFDAEPFKFSAVLNRILAKYGIEEMMKTFPYEPEALQALLKVKEFDPNSFLGAEEGKGTSGKSAGTPSYDNPAMEETISAKDAMAALGVKTLTQGEMLVLSEAVTMERAALGLDLKSTKGNSVPFIQIFRKYMESQNGGGKGKKTPRKRRKSTKSH